MGLESKVWVGSPSHVLRCCSHGSSGGCTSCQVVVVIAVDPIYGNPIHRAVLP